MRKFLLTNEQFSGQAEITYNSDGKLIKIDVANAEMTKDVITRFKQAVPATLDDLLSGNAFSGKTIVSSVDYEVSFEEFWQRYPLHRNRYKVEQIWHKLTNNEKIEVFENAEKYNKYCKRNSSWLNPMIADRYLRDKEYKTNWDKVK